LWAKVENQRKAGNFTVDIIGNDKRKARQAIVTVRFCTVRLRSNRRPQKRKLPPVKLTTILVREDELLRIHKTSLLPKSPRQHIKVIRWITQLDGFLGRKSDGEPGTVPIWRSGKDFRILPPRGN
jgi:hypothetical protein